MDDYGILVHRNRWVIAAAGGALAFLLFLLSVDWGFFGSLVAGLIVFGLLSVLIGLVAADAGSGADRRVGGSVSSEPESRRGGTGVTPGVAAGAGGAGGAATSATSPAATGTPVGEGARNGSATGPVATSPASARAAASASQATGGATRDQGTVADPTPKPREEASPPLASPSPTAADDRPAPAHSAAEPATPATAAGDVGSKPATLSAPRDGSADDLKAIKGVGPKLENLCNSLGFWHFDQIAGWSDAEIDWVDAHLEGFKGRVRRDDWVAQASALASGGAA